MLFDHLVEPGDPVIVEAPSYDRTLLALEARGAELLRRCRSRPTASTWARSRRRSPPALQPSFAHIIPNFHNPAGCTLSLEKRERLLELAAEYDFVIFEDDPYRDVRFEGEDLPTMLSLDTAEQRRVRELVLEDDRARRPGRIPDRARGPDGRDHQARRSTPTSRRTCWRRRSSASSAARARSSASIETVKHALRERRDAVAEGARASTSATRRASSCPRAATSCGSSCGEDVDTTALLAAAAERGVTFVAGSDFMLEGGTNALRLAYSAVTPEQVDRGHPAPRRGARGDQAAGLRRV